MPTYDDDLEPLPGDRPPPPFPPLVMIAGVIWIGFGALGLIGTVVSIGMAGAQAQQGGAGNAGSGCCGGLIAIAFLVCGYQTVKGTARDTLGNGIGSLLLGGLYLLLAGLVGFGGFLLGGGNQQNNAKADELKVVIAITGAILGVMGMLLVVAGILALAGRSAYREWREASAPPKRRRRRPDRDRDEDEDEDL